MSSDRPQQFARPFTVTLLVILLWINAIYSVFLGITILVASDDSALLEIYGNEGTVATTAGWVYLIFGIVIALIAIRISQGGTFLRMLLTIVLVFRIAADIVYLFSEPGPAALGILVNLLLLWLMWNTKANTFFSQK